MDNQVFRLAIVDAVARGQKTVPPSKGKAGVLEICTLVEQHRHPADPESTLGEELLTQGCPSGQRGEFGCGEVPFAGIVL